ncbi:MAG: hypothetical protein ACO2YR_05520 [Nitrosopumilaceae archaeon]
MSNIYALKKEGLSETKTREALGKLLVDRKNEFREISDMILPKTSLEPIKNWEEFVLNFCLDVNDAFKTWSGEMNLNSNSPQKALTILRQLSRNKTSMNHLSHLMNISYDLAEEFKEIYKRL